MEPRATMQKETQLDQLLAENPNVFKQENVYKNVASKEEAVEAIDQILHNSRQTGIVTPSLRKKLAKSRLRRRHSFK